MPDTPRERIEQALPTSTLGRVLAHWDSVRDVKHTQEDLADLIEPLVEQAIREEREKLIGEAEKHFGPIAFRAFKRQLDTLEGR